MHDDVVLIVWWYALGMSQHFYLLQFNLKYIAYALPNAVKSPKWLIYIRGINVIIKRTINYFNTITTFTIFWYVRVPSCLILNL